MDSTNWDATIEPRAARKRGRSGKAETGHEFSEGYRLRKKALIEEAAHSETESKSGRKTPRPGWRAAAAVAAALCVVAPIGAWAATSHADFLDGAFGAAWRQSEPAVQGFQDQGGAKPPVPVIYPGSEVEQLDPDKAEALIGEAVCDEPVTVSSPDGHELTVTSAVRSENAIAYRFLLHRDGGVTCLDWEDGGGSVATKGVRQSEDAAFSWAAGGDDFIYVDRDASDEETVVGYGYSVFGEPLPEGAPVQLTAWTSDASLGEGDVDVRTFEIPCTEALDGRAFASGDGSEATVSPLGLVLDMGSIFAAQDGSQAQDLARDPGSVRSVSLEMADGESYVVFDRADYLDNSLAACSFGTDFSMVFNRLVDPDEVESIEVVVTDESGMDVSPDERPTRTVIFAG